MEFLSCAKAPIHRQHMAFLHGLNIRSVHLGVIGISPMDGDATIEAEQKRCLVLPGIEVQLHLWWSTLRLRSCDSMRFHAIPWPNCLLAAIGIWWNGWRKIVWLTSAGLTSNFQLPSGKLFWMLCYAVFAFVDSLTCLQPTPSHATDPPNADMLRSPIWIMHFSNSAIFSSTLLWSTFRSMRVRLNLYRETRKSCQSHV